MISKGSKSGIGCQKTMTIAPRRNPRRACAHRARVPPNSSALSLSASSSSSDSDLYHSPPPKRRSSNRRQQEFQSHNDCNNGDEKSDASDHFVPKRRPKRTSKPKRQKSSAVASDASDASFEAPGDVDSPRASDIDDVDIINKGNVVEEISEMTINRRNNSRRDTKRTLKPTAVPANNENPQDTQQASLTPLSEAQHSLLSSLFKVFDSNATGGFSVSDILRVADDHGLDFTEDEARDMVRFWDSSNALTISHDAFTQIALDSKFVVRSTK